VGAPYVSENTILRDLSDNFFCPGTHTLGSQEGTSDGYGLTSDQNGTNRSNSASPVIVEEGIILRSEIIVPG